MSTRRYASRRRLSRRQKRIRVLRRRVLTVSLLAVLLISFLIIRSCLSGRDPAQEEYVISEACEAYRPEVERQAAGQEMTEYVDLIMAVMMQESAGAGTDVMQSSECQFNTEYPREPNGITDPSYSISCGIRELHHALVLAEAEGPEDLRAIKLALQGYNFGSDSYIHYMKEQGEAYWSAESAAAFAEMASGGVMREESDPFYHTAGKWQYGDQYYPEHVLRYYESEGRG